MSGKYVPPGRRPKPEGAVGEKPPAEDASMVSLEEIRAHFWPSSGDDASRFPDSGNRTLHDSAATPGKLAYLILFNGANPQWGKDNIIFTKSSLDLLPAQLADDPSKAPPSTEQQDSIDATTSEADANNKGPDLGGDAGHAAAASEGSPEKPTHSANDAQTPIAVFKHARKADIGRFLRFDGYYQIDKLAFLVPNSPELVKMLEKKWEKVDRFGDVRPQQRSEEKWKESLSHRWAVLKLKRDEVAEKELGVPGIERLPDLDPDSPKVAKKSVNEMLAEMRLGDQNADSTAAE